MKYMRIEDQAINLSLNPKPREKVLIKCLNSYTGFTITCVTFLLICSTIFATHRPSFSHYNTFLKSYFRERADIRLATYKSNCKRYSEQTRLVSISNDTPISSINSSNIKFDLKHGIAYCFPPKVGAKHNGITNWEKLSTSIRTNSTIEDIEKNSDAEKYSSVMHGLLPSALEVKDNHSSKLSDIKHGVILSRHPLTRFYSTWYHLFTKTGDLSNPTILKQVKIIKSKFYKPETDALPSNNMLVGFNSFLRFISSKEAHGEFGNPGWAKITDLCLPCELEFYDYLVHVETSKKDGDRFLKDLGYSWVGKLPEQFTEDNIQEVQQFYREKVSFDVLQQVYGTYYWDFELFGYTLEGFKPKADLNHSTQ